MDQHFENVKHVINAGWFMTGVSTLLGWLPPALSLVLTLVGIGWYGVLYYDRFIGKRRNNDGAQ